MNIRDILDSQINERQIKERILREGSLVLQVISQPGWDLILGALIAAKINAENLRKKSLGKVVSGDQALYYSGVVDGIESSKEAIYGVVKAAEEMRDNQGERNHDE